MTFDALRPWFLVGSNQPLRSPKRSLSAQEGGFPWPTTALILAMVASSACKSCVPAYGAASGEGGTCEGPSGSITVSPLGDALIGPREDFDPDGLHRTYVIANETREPLGWEALISEPWLVLVGPQSGILPAGASVEVSVDVDPFMAGGDGQERAVGEITFLESATEVVLGRPTVTVAASFAGPGGGWTNFTPSADTLMVYVSGSSGSDLSDGLTPATPKSTLAAAKALLRNGYPDWLLLKRGDVWQESLGQWKTSGRSTSEPMLVSTYGSAAERPLLRTGAAGGIWTNGGGGSPATIDNLAIVGLHFQAAGYTGGGDCVGVQLLQPGSHLLIEDCKLEGYSDNIVFQGYGGRHADFRLRRSVIVDAYTIHAIGGHSQGLYAYAVDGLLIEENVFDHNGWNENVPGAEADIYSHNLYIDNDNTGVDVRGNVIANASSHGVQLRPGGSVVNNLFVRNSISLSVGGGTDPNSGGVTADVHGNVILDGKDIDAANPRGWGLWLGNIESGNVVHNVIANNTLGTQPNMMTLDGQYVGNSSPGIGVHDLVIERNIFFNWGGSVLFKGDSSQITNVEFIDNEVQNTSWPTSLLEHLDASSTATLHSSGNQFFCQPVPTPAWTEVEFVPHPIDYWIALVEDLTSTAAQVAYVEPLRSVASYNAFLGGTASVEAFMAEARLQSRANWRRTYTAVMVNRYIRAGF